jgi:hypothetical protein
MTELHERVRSNKTARNIPNARRVNLETPVIS